MPAPSQQLSWFDQAFGLIGNYSAQGADSTGTVADYLIQAGLGVAAVSQILNGISVSANATPQQIRYVQDEIRYLNDQYYRPQQNSWLLPVAILGGLWLLMRKD